LSYLFISHSSQNNFEAIALHDWLLKEGWDDLFLDLDPTRGIAAGERWEKALHDAAHRCDAVLFLVSQAWLDSEWCRKEFRLAHRLNKRIIGLLIEDIPINELPDELTETWQLVNLASGNDHALLQAKHPQTGNEQHVHFSQSGLAQLRTGLVKAGLDPRFFEWPPTHDAKRPPYRGMRPLEMEDAGIFFGREAPTIDLLARLRGLREDPPPRFLAILGASGAGKSSFLRAGILPRLSRDERHFLPLPIVRPEASVLWGDDGLLASLTKACKTHKLGINRKTLRDAIDTEPETLATTLNELAQKAAPPSLEGDLQTTQTLILSIDQGEELFQSEGAEEAKIFLSLIHFLSTHPSLPLIILFTIRSDAYEQLQTTKALEGVQQQTFSLAPMPRGAFQAVIEGPAARLKDSDHPLVIEAALTERLLEDIDKGGSKDALPLLAFTLERLYLDYGDDGDLRLDEYVDMGGIEGAIEAAVAQAFKAAQQDPALPNDRQALETLLRRGLIPWLAGIDPDTQSSRRRIAKLSEIPAEAQPIVQHLIEQRLLATDVNKETKEVTLEPAHEALLRQWGLLQGWLEEDFAALTTLEALQRASRDWEANERSDDWLNHTAGRLEDAEALKQREDLEHFLNPADRDYLQACIGKDNEQRDKALAEAKKLAEAQRRQALAQARVAKRTKLGLVVAMVLAVFASTAGWKAWQNLKIAEQNQEKAETQLIEANHNYGLALIQRAKKAKQEHRFIESAYFNSSATANLKQGAISNSAKASFVDSINASSIAWSSKSQSHHDDPVNSVAFSPDGQTLASASSDNTIKLWNVATGQLINTIKGHNQKISSIAFSIDGRSLSSASGKMVRLWNIDNGQLITSLAGHTDDVSSIAYSPNGKTLASASYDNTIRLWDVTNNQLVDTFLGHESLVLDVAFSSDGQTLASSSSDKTIRLWDIKTRQLTTTLENHNSDANSIVFSPDSKILAAGSDDKTIRLWDLESHETIATLEGHESAILSLAFSPIANTLVSGSGDNTIKLWNISEGKVIATLDGHTYEVRSVTFSPDGKSLVTGSADTTVRLWNVSNHNSITQLNGHFDDVLSATYSPDGKVIASGSVDTTIRLWDASTGKTLATLAGHTDSVNSISFSPDGKILASGSSDTTIKLWDTSSLETLHTITSHTEEITQLVFSPGGKYLASGSKDKTFKLWNLDSKEEALGVSGFDGAVANIAFSPDGKSMAATTGENSFFIWHPDTDEFVESTSEQTIESISFSPDGGMIVFGLDKGELLFWSTADNKEMGTVEIDESLAAPLSKIKFSPTSNTLAWGALDNTVRLWDINKKEFSAVLVGHTSFIESIEFSPDGKTLVSASADNTVKIWNIADESLISPRSHSMAEIYTVAVSSDDQTLALGLKDKTIQLWDISQKRLLKVLAGLDSDDSSLKFSPDGKLLVSGSDGSIDLWDAITGEHIKELWAPWKTQSLLFTSDSQFMISANKDEGLKVFKMPEGHFLHSLIQLSLEIQEHDSISDAKILLDDQTIVVSTYAGKVILVDINNKATPTLLTSNINLQVISISPSPDGETLALGSYDNTIKIWDLTTKQQIKTLHGHTGPVSDIAFSADGQTLASTSTDGSIKLWNTSNWQLISTLGGPSFFVEFLSNSTNILMSLSDKQTVRLRDLNFSQKLTTRSYSEEWASAQKEIMGLELHNLELIQIKPPQNLYGVKIPKLF